MREEMNALRQPAIGGQYRPVSTLVEADAKPPFPLSDDGSRFAFRHLGEVEDVPIALSTEPDALIAVHVLPGGFAWAGNVKVKLGIRGHVRSDVRGPRTIYGLM
jgi:hypothetical protein